MHLSQGQREVQTEADTLNVVQKETVKIIQPNSSLEILGEKLGFI